MTAKLYTFYLPNLCILFTDQEAGSENSAEILKNIKLRVQVTKRLLAKIRADLKEEYSGKGNPVGTQFDLIPAGALADKTVVVLMANDDKEINDNFFNSTHQKWLENLGLNVAFTKDYSQFSSLLSSSGPDLVWIISGNEANQYTDELVEKIVDLHKQGVGLFLFGDNDPYNIEVNATLKRIVCADCALEGNYPGRGTLHSTTGKLGRGTFDAKHPVATGLFNLYEGNKISHPTAELISDQYTKVFAYSTKKSNPPQPSILYRMAPPSSDEDAGIVWIDTDFTKLSPTPDLEEETRRYVSNVSGFICRKSS